MFEKISSLYGNAKNMTYTQSVGNCNAGVGFSLALILRDIYPNTFIIDWYWYLLAAALFVSPGLYSTYKQFRTGYSLPQIGLRERPFRYFQ